MLTYVSVESLPSNGVSYPADNYYLQQIKSLKPHDLEETLISCIADTQHMASVHGFKLQDGSNVSAAESTVAAVW